MAIMGASGSGKTSLLNVFGQRLGLSPGSKMTGEMRCNNRVLQSNDFGKIGAFVQQDDVLLETFTPAESFRFAAKLRTTLSDRQINIKVKNLIERLGLKACQNTYIGGVIMKGISGGERKRTSIGYELITDPKLLLCDEPTSGLDSSTALRIIQMLRKEAEINQLTIICTIHQPSAEIFTCFDRLLLLQDGYQIFQGDIPDIPTYLNDHLGVKLKPFANPADYIIKMAQNPSLCRQGLTFEQMVSSYQTNLAPQILREITERTSRYSDIQTNFQDFQDKRQSNFFTQFIWIFYRNFLFMIRNKKALAGIIFNSLIIGLVVLAVFFQVGKFPNLYAYPPTPEGFQEAQVEF